MVDFTTYIFLASVFYGVVGVASHGAAIQQAVTTAYGKQVTLFCNTEDRAPLSYCQFEPPAGEPFSIDSDVTPEKPILERFYFPANKNLDRGDCAVFIHSVQHQDVGRWNCSAGLDDVKKYQGTIIVQVKGLYTVPEAGVANEYVAVSVAGYLVVVIFLVIKIKRRRQLNVRPESNNERQTRLSILIKHSIKSSTTPICLM